MIHNYKELKCGQYLRICDILKTEPDEEKDLAILSVLSGKTTDELLDMPLDDYLAIKQDASFLFEAPELGEPDNTYEVGQFVCTVVKDFRRLTAGQFLDFQDVRGDLVSLLSIILVPANHTYGNGYDIIDLQDAIREHLSAYDALTLNAFFLRLTRRYAHDTVISSARKIQRSKMSRTEKETLLTLLSQADGDGQGRYTVCPKSATLLWERYAKSQLADS